MTIQTHTYDVYIKSQFRFNRIRIIIIIIIYTSIILLSLYNVIWLFDRKSIIYVDRSSIDFDE